MSERDKYIETVCSNLKQRDILEQIAEEAAELAQAALKLIRARGYSESKTPIKPEDAMDNMIEEAVDVLMALDVYGIAPEDLAFEQAESWKWRRWAERLEGGIKCLKNLK